jgi:chromosome segregation ATPase
MQELFEQRSQTEAESASHRANDVEKSVAEDRSEVETLRNAFREVRELAEGAQKKAESTEARLGRVTPLEAKVSVLRPATVVEQPH